MVKIAPIGILAALVAGCAADRMWLERDGRHEARTEWCAAESDGPPVFGRRNTAEVWTWQREMPVEIAAEFSGCSSTATQVAAVAGALREPLPGFEFEEFWISCYGFVDPSCRTVSVAVQGWWHDVNVHVLTDIDGSQPRLAGVSAMTKLLGSPLVTALLDVRSSRSGGHGMAVAFEDAVGPSTLTIDEHVHVAYYLQDDVVDLSWPIGVSDEITVALERLGKWKTIVALEDAGDNRYPGEPEWVRRAWLDLGGAAVGRPPSADRPAWFPDFER